MTDAKRAQKVLHSVKAHGIIHSRHGAFGKRLSHSPLKAVSRVRIPYALPFFFVCSASGEIRGLFSWLCFARLRQSLTLKQDPQASRNSVFSACITTDFFPVLQIFISKFGNQKFFLDSDYL